MFCKVCGKELSEGALFCGNCGSKVEVVKEAVEAVVTATEEVVAVAEEAVENLAATAEETVEEKTIAIEDAIEEKIDAAKEAVEEKVVAIEENVEGTVADAVENIADTTSVLQEAAETVVAETPVAEAEPVVTPTPVAVPVPPLSVPQVDKAAVKAEAKAAKEALKAAKAEAKAERKRYMVKRNTVLSSISCVFLSLVTTAVMFMAATLAVLCTKEFDEFYYGFISDNRAEYDVFWIMTSVWYLYAVAAILVLLILLIFSMIKKRKYAIFNYVGIPMIINGIFFALIALLNKWIMKTFELPELFEELFDVIGDEAKNTVLFVGIIMLAAGALLVLIYVLISVIHKAAYRKKCVKAECNQ